MKYPVLLLRHGFLNDLGSLFGCFSHQQGAARARAGMAVRLAAACLALQAVCQTHAQSDDCGVEGQQCCQDGFCEDVDSACTDGICQPLKAGVGLCEGKGRIGEPCCILYCEGKNAVCAEGTCVDKTAEPVLDQSGGPPPGAVGGACIGANEICDDSGDEDAALVECVEGICTQVAAAVVEDQSVRSAPDHMIVHAGCAYT